MDGLVMGQFSSI